MGCDFYKGATYTPAYMVLPNIYCKLKHEHFSTITLPAHYVHAYLAPGQCIFPDILSIYYIPTPLTVHFPMTHSVRYQPIFHTLYFTLNCACVLNNVVTTTVIEMIEMVEILDGRVGKRSVERVRYVIQWNFLKMDNLGAGVSSYIETLSFFGS